MAGGLTGFLKAKSKMSLAMSTAFAVVLALCALGWLRVPYLVDVLLIFLLVFFTSRLMKSKKFMPGGFMAVVTLITLVLLHVSF
jgi:uncharacterized membrane protein (UPF0136 family)